MDALRTVEVYIIGELDTPGTYSLNALSTGISALFTSGGPNKSGSLRDIRVFYSGELVKSIDLYEFFIKGTKGNDIRLQQGYTIFIPIIGPVVGIAGQVKRPAIYEMKGEQTIGEIIELAGGVLPTGHRCVPWRWPTGSVYPCATAFFPDSSRWERGCAIRLPRRQLGTSWSRRYYWTG